MAGNVAGAAAGGSRRGRGGQQSEHLAVDDLTGHRQDLLTAGLYPHYVYKKVCVCVCVCVCV